MKFSLLKKVLSLVVCLVALVALVGCKEDDSKVITVGASPAPHAQILEQCKEYIESKGYTLKIVEYTDYVLPNVGVTEGSLDANFFQHTDYLTKYNASNNTEIVSVLKVHLEPLGIYAGKSNDLSNVADGASIGIPNDESNCARALLLLEQLELIELDSSKGLNVTVKDITSNPKNLVIRELEAQQLPAQLPSFDFAVINGNYAISAGIKDSLLDSEAKEGSAAQNYCNILCVNKGNEENEKIKILIEALTQQNIKDFIDETFDGLAVPMFD